MKKKPQTDETLGIALSAFVRSETAGKCLPSDAIWALAQKKVKGKERDNILMHLSSCDQCYRAFLLASDISSHSLESPILAPDKKVASLLSRHRVRTYLPYALAASLVLSVLSFLVIHTAPPGQPVSIAQNHERELNHENPVAPPGEKVAQPSAPSRKTPQPQKKRPKSQTQPVLVAKIEPDERLQAFLMNSREEKITNEKDRVMVVAMVKSSGLNFDAGDVREVHIEQPRTVIKSFAPLPKYAEIKIRDGVMTIRVLPAEEERHEDESR